MSTMERILRLMGEKKASDIYLSAYAPAMIKINGQCLPINAQLLPPEGDDRQYRIKSSDEPHERVVKESQLNRDS